MLLALALIPAIYSHSPGSLELQIFVSIRVELPAGSSTHGRLAPLAGRMGSLRVSVDEMVAKSNGAGLGTPTHFQLLIDGAEGGIEDEHIRLKLPKGGQQCVGGDRADQLELWPSLDCPRQAVERDRMVVSHQNTYPTARRAASSLRQGAYDPRTDQSPLQASLNLERSIRMCPRFRTTIPLWISTRRRASMGSPTRTSSTLHHTQ